MQPIKFEGSQPIAKPPSMTDEQCSSLDIVQGQTEPDGWPFTLSCWQPTKADIEAINAGRPIWLRILSHRVHPILMFTLDEKNEVNK